MFVIVGLCAVLVIMAVGFAAFSSQLQINGTSQITSTWCLGFDIIYTNNIQTKAGLTGATAPAGIGNNMRSKLRLRSKSISYLKSARG